MLNKCYKRYKCKQQSPIISYHKRTIIIFYYVYMSLNINRFKVLNTTNGLMLQNGRNSNLNVIASQNIVINNLTNGTNVPGSPYTISSGDMFNIGHIGLTYIKIINNNVIRLTENCIYVPDNYIRVIYLGGITDSTNSLLYGFANSQTQQNISLNVLIANTNSQTIGDYFDIELPDRTYFPNLYVVLYVLNGAWNNRTIINDNVCSITSTNCLSYCINPQYSLNDVTLSHFIFVNGTNNILGIPTRLSIGVEDQLISEVNDYSQLKLSISSKYIDESYVNDTFISIPICYVKGSKILCLIDNKEIYINIENITAGTLIKTHNNGYKKVLHCVKSFVINNVMSKINNRIYKTTNAFGDLLVTGGHSILVDELTEQQIIETNKIFGIRKIQNKYRLLACISDKFVAIDNENRYDIYHITLGDEEIIYVNGILSETFDLKWYENEFVKKKLLCA